MDYEKKYKEALNLARSYYDENANQFLDTLFPELAESEDERIRKEIIHYILYDAKGVSEEQEHMWVTYLEKQKGQKKSLSEKFRPDFPKVADFIESVDELEKARAIEILEDYLKWAVSSEEECRYTWKELANAIQLAVDTMKEQKPEQYDIDVLEKHITKDSISELAHTVIVRNGWEIVEKEQKPVERWQYVGKVDLEENKKEENSNIELIQKSWYMEGYHDKEFNNEPKWIIKTGEGGPRYEENPKYGKLIEQKSAEWSEDYKEEDIQTRFAFYTYKDDPSVLYLSNVFVEESSRNHGFGTRILKAAEKAAEAIGAITISLKVKQDSPANAWYRKRGYGYVAFEDGYDWLEKNLEYLKPKPKQEWSEEDESYLQTVINEMEANKKEAQEYEHKNYDAIISWLKYLPLSLKKRNEDVAKLCSNEWSEEDEEMRDYIIHALTNSTYAEEGPAIYTKEIDWLKSLRPSWKPSEDEERLINTSISFLKDFANKGYENAVECIDWLRSKLNGNTCK